MNTPASLPEVLAILAGNPGLDAVGLLNGLACQRTSRTRQETGDPAMTAPKDPATAARRKALAAAKRALKHVLETAIEHDKILADGGVPSSGFAAIAQKYERHLAEIDLLDGLGTTAEPDNGMVEVSPDDLGPFLQLVRQAFPDMIAAAGPDSSFGKLEAAIPPFSMAPAEAGDGA